MSDHPADKNLLSGDQAGRLSLWADVRPMIDLSEMAYELVLIRQACRDGRVAAAAAGCESSANSILQPPFHLGVVLDIVRRNEELVQELRGEHQDDIDVGCSGDIGSVRERLTALQRHALKLEEKEKEKEKLIQLDGYVRGRGEEVGYGVDGTAGGFSVDNVVFLEVDDEFATSGGVVYIIALNHHLRRVTVAFRGSTTKYDFKTDLDLQLKTVDNPLWVCSSSSSSSEHQAPTFKVHTGFHKYLFQTPTKHSKHTDRDEESGLNRKPSKHNEEGGESGPLPDSKFDIILRRVVDVLKEHEGYSLYCTGHSLGGGLATMFAFYAAVHVLQDDELLSLFPMPIKCINVGSPMVGNNQFRRAFEALEQENRMRQLRIVNGPDPIPKMPLWDPCHNCCICYNQSGVYRHVGMRLVLFGRRPPLHVLTGRLLNPFWVFACCMFLCRYGHRPEYLLSYQTMPNGRLRLAYIDLLQFVKYWILFGFLCWDGPASTRFHSTSEYWDRMSNMKHVLENLSLEELYDKALENTRFVLVGRTTQQASAEEYL